MGLRSKPKPAADANGNEINPNAIYVAIDGFCTGPLGFGEVVVQRGDRYRGNHEAVALAPAMWLPDPATTDELNAARQRLGPVAVS